MLANGFGYGLGPVARAELLLRLLEVAAYGFLAEPECGADFGGRLAQ